MTQKKRFFAKHAKSSAALISLGIHAVLILVALSFVAVTVIQRDDQKFEAKPVKRPKMAMKKLQVPVNIKKKRVQKPKLRKRIVVQPKMNQTMPDIKMPEISGVKGGIGSAGGAGLGGAGGVGFSMPEIEIFGVKGKGEKIFLILDSFPEMMHDRMGGIRAYTIIKEELIRIVEELPPTALFNVAAFEWNGVALAFPTMVPASGANASRMKEWIMPLNSVKKGMGADDYGLQTLGKGGVRNNDNMNIGVFADTKKVGGKSTSRPHKWFNAAMLAHAQQADTIFLLVNTWGNQRVSISKTMSREEWNETSAGKKWAEAYKKGLKMLDEENEQRKANDEPPKVLARNEWTIMKEYFDGMQRPPVPEWYYFTPRDFAEAFMLTREKYKPKEIQTTSGFGSKKKSKKPKIDFSFNVIQFVQQGGDAGDYSENDGKFNTLAGLCKGEYKTVSGLEEVESYVTSDYKPDSD
ncbi:vWA domain-containing protein [Pontiella sulfatireligans]|uniref:VWFA domain-containing protein n=1 Tax=Pontiella sulfatireligans TaxID=2750658 RepID=A0A6C2UKM9_9BACT|nr:hypothetical protein [Pontiella sulfatireligans]VGO20443.1 hypothetical protein SCARR_02506 [Pontiella sulfatireligans]